MKTLSLLALAAGCSGGSNLGNTPILGAAAWTNELLGVGYQQLPYSGPAFAANGGIAFAPNGDVMIAGSFSGSVTFGDPVAHAAMHGENAFISRRSRVDGSQVWSRIIETLGAMKTEAFVVDSAGNSYIAGLAQDGADFGGTTVMPAEGLAFVAKYNSEGALIWAHGYGALEAASLTLMPDGSVLVAGHWGQWPETMALPSGKTEACPTATNSGHCDDWMIVLDGNGTPIRDAFVPANVERIAVLPDGTLAIAGTVTVLIPGVEDEPGIPATADTPVLMALAADGTVLQTTHLAPAPTKFPVVQYDTSAMVATDDGIVTSSGSDDASLPQYLTSFDTTGAVAWSVHPSGAAGLDGIARAPDGSLIGVGSMSGATVDFGHGPVPGETYIATYRANGTFVDARTFGPSVDPSQTVANAKISAVAVADDGAVAWAGTTGSQIDFGTGPVKVLDGSSTSFVFGLIAPPLP